MKLQIKATGKISGRSMAIVTSFPIADVQKEEYQHYLKSKLQFYDVLMTGDSFEEYEFSETYLS